MTPVSAKFAPRERKDRLFWLTFRISPPTCFRPFSPPNSPTHPPTHQQIPQSLHTENGYDHREALFGIPPYGGSIAQNVYYADSTLCDQNVDTTKGWPKRDKNEPWKPPYILMVDRGDCTFVQKVSEACMQLCGIVSSCFIFVSFSLTSR